MGMVRGSDIPTWGTIICATSAFICIPKIVARTGHDRGKTRQEPVPWASSFPAESVSFASQ
jgi:hypothetical protein